MHLLGSALMLKTVGIRILRLIDAIVAQLKKATLTLFPTLQETDWVFFILFIGLSLRLRELSVLFIYILFAKQISLVLDDMLGTLVAVVQKVPFPFVFYACLVWAPSILSFFYPTGFILFAFMTRTLLIGMNRHLIPALVEFRSGSPVFNGEEIPETGSGSSKYRVSAFNDTTHTHFHHKLSGPQFERYMAYLEQRERNNYKLRMGGLCVTAVACVGLACAGAYVFTSRFPVSPLPKETPKE